VRPVVIIYVQKKPTAARRALFGEIEGVERAEQEGKGTTVGVCGIPFEGQFQGGSFKANRLCKAVVFP
jgi:hypothetical protein